MTEKSKELVDWIKDRILDVERSCQFMVDDDVKDKYISMMSKCDEAIKFLDSLPEIESRLCKGGYIQDDNGTPCCDGDMVRFVTNSDYEGYGYLKWNRNEKRFLIEEIVDKYSIGCDFVMFGLKQFRKVEPGLKGTE